MEEKMKTTMNGHTIEGTPQEIMQLLQATKTTPKPSMSMQRKRRRKNSYRTWTPEEDMLLTQGKKINGRTQASIYSRRAKLRREAIKLAEARYGIKPVKEESK